MYIFVKFYTPFRGLRGGLLVYTRPEWIHILNNTSKILFQRTRFGPLSTNNSIATMDLCIKDFKVYE